MISGDFNALLKPPDRVSKVPVSLAEVKDFSDCCQNLFLNEVPWIGDYHTWSNKQQGSDRVCNKLDRILGDDA